jgi:hypothetical protein
MGYCAIINDELQQVSSFFTGLIKPLMSFKWSIKAALTGGFNVSPRLAVGSVGQNEGLPKKHRTRMAGP